MYFCHETVNLTVILNFICVKMTMNCEYDSVVGVILPVENKLLPIVHLILKLTKTLYYTFCQKHSGCVFASGKNGSTPFIHMFVLLTNLLCIPDNPIYCLFA